MFCDDARSSIDCDVQHISCRKHVLPEPNMRLVSIVGLSPDHTVSDLIWIASGGTSQHVATTQIEFILHLSLPLHVATEPAINADC